LQTQPQRTRQCRGFLLGAAWRDHDLVFPTSIATPINPNNLVRDYNRLVERAGVPRIRIHDQRHTHASLMLQMGTERRHQSGE